MDLANPGVRTPGADEAAGLRAALAAASRDLAALSQRAGGEAADILEFQLALIDDDGLTGPAFAAVGDGTPADVAWRRVMDGLIADYRAHPSESVRARALDVADLRDRALAALQGAAAAPPPPAGAIVVSDDLPPSRFLEIDWSAGGGVALSRGSATSHTAILARARGVPMVVQLGDIPQASRALLDGEEGLVELDPGEDEVRAFEARRAAHRLRRAAAARGGQPAKPTYRGEPVRLLINIEGPGSLSHPAADLADGVGLLRSEFLYAREGEAPDEEAQFQAYAEVLRWAGARPVTIRTVDAGGDKPIRGLSEAGEANPFLGLRGLRLSLKRPAIFATQLRALARAAALGDLKVMFPMVTAPREFAAAQALLLRVVDDLSAEGKAARAPELGMMVEVPAAALTVADFPAAFYSIGDNDLAQYVAAADRANGAVSGLLDPTGPAMLELIRRVVDHGRASGRRVSLCGDAAGDPSRIPALLACGLREFSVSPGALAAAKAAILASEEARRV